MSGSVCMRIVAIGGALLAQFAAWPVVAQTPGVQFYSQGDMVRVERSELSDEATIKGAIEALVAGPSQEEIDQGILSAIPAGTRIVSLVVTENEVSVDLSEEILNGLSEAALLAIYDQFRLTLVNWPELERIVLTCHGALLSSFLEPDQPVERPLTQDSDVIINAVGLGGRKVTIGPSHGRRWNGSGWYWQRTDPCGYGEAVLEDTNSIRLCQFLYSYLAQDGATVFVHREMNESNCCHPDTGMPWWKMCAQSWLKHAGYPCSIWAPISGSCGAETATSRSSDDIRCRPKFADYHGSDIYISYHTNGAAGTGTETFRDTQMTYPAHEANSYSLATAVNNSIVSGIRDMYDGSWANRGVKDSAGGFGEIRVPNQPAILIELAFHDRCDKDAIYLQDNFFRSVAGWSIYRGVCQYFGVTPGWDKYSCEYVSDTIPSTMAPGQSYNVSVTFRNRGVVWSNARSFRLGAVNDSDPFTSGNRVNVSGEIKPGATYTFNFVMTAPSTPGVYTTDWRMVRDGVGWFGPTHAEQVQVTGEDTPPVILNHPANQHVVDGVTVSFNVSAGGTPPLAYQWQKNSADLSNGGRISGATSATLQITGVTTADAGNYRCIVSNALGSATSNQASLTVGPSTWIVESRSGGQNYSTHFSRSGSWLDVTGKSSAAGCTAGIGHIYTSAIYAGRSAIYRFTPSSTGLWRVYATWVPSENGTSTANHVVTHAGGSAHVVKDMKTGGNTWNLLGEYTLNAGTQYSVTQTSDPISPEGIIRADAIKWERVVIDPPQITAHPANRNICPGTNTTFAVTATGSGTLSYQWQKDGANLSNGGHYSGATTATLTVTGADAGDAGSYRCTVSNAGGSVTSNAGALSLKTATTVTQQPEPQSVPEGSSVVFTVAAEGEGTISYKWQKDGVDLANDGRITGVTSDTLSIDSVVVGDGGDYQCVVTAGCGAATSAAAALNIELPPTVPGDTDDDGDVDVEDFGLIQACLTGLGEPQNDPACEKAKLDDDADVDDYDIEIFIRCMTGPGVQGSFDCAED